jgi:hypothetical protein
MRYFGKRAVILWAVLVVMFLVIWQFMNAHHEPRLRVL